jgi:hypothetical protein
VASRITAKGLAGLAIGDNGVASRVMRIRFAQAFGEVKERKAACLRAITEQLYEQERRIAPSGLKQHCSS